VCPEEPPSTDAGADDDDPGTEARDAGAPQAPVLLRIKQKCDDGNEEPPATVDAGQPRPIELL
jgi:hypothetical protein